MSDISDLRQTARALFDQGIAAANPARALADRLNAQPLSPLPPPGRYFLLAIGKAAVAMLREARRHLPDNAACLSLAVTNPENAHPIPGCQILSAGHPIPDARSATAGHAVIKFLAPTTAQDHVIALISGGGSALVVAPSTGLTLKDKIIVNQLMLSQGLDIIETNLVRQQLSDIKGGKLAVLASPAKISAFILSDVIGDDLRAVASGLTVGAIGDQTEAVALLRDRGIFQALPPNVQHFLSIKTTAPPARPTDCVNTLIGSNRLSLDRILAANTEFFAKIVNDRLVGDVAAVARSILDHARTSDPATPTMLIFGGETTVKVTGTGSGGRNQELALRFALGAKNLPGNWVFLSGGTDGRDGPTLAAGGLVDPASGARMAANGLDPCALLSNNDSFAALKAAGDLLLTGATGTNVADIQIFLRRPTAQPCAGANIPGPA